MFWIKFGALYLTLIALPACQGFGITSPNKSQIRPFSSPIIGHVPHTTRDKVLMNSVDEDSTAEEPSAEIETGDEISTEDDDDDDDVSAADENINDSEDEEDEEDDEVESLKEEIAELEETLKAKNREINSIEKLAEQYTEAGYARQVAEMESFRRSRTANAVDVKTVARAEVLQNFLPIVDELDSLSEKYADDEFVKKYSALSWDFRNALKDMGVEEFFIQDGEKRDLRRVKAVDQEYSDSIPKGHIIRSIEGSKGYELEGNVMRMVEAVISLGPEIDEEEDGSEVEVKGEEEIEDPSSEAEDVVTDDDSDSDSEN